MKKIHLKLSTKAEMGSKYPKNGPHSLCMAPIIDFYLQPKPIIGYLPIPSAPPLIANIYINSQCMMMIVTTSHTYPIFFFLRKEKWVECEPKNIYFIVAISGSIIASINGISLWWVACCFSIIFPLMNNLYIA